jgi:hypothetical protein
MNPEKIVTLVVKIGLLGVACRGHRGRRCRCRRVAGRSPLEPCGKSRAARLGLHGMLAARVVLNLIPPHSPRTRQ